MVSVRRRGGLGIGRVGGRVIGIVIALAALGPGRGAAAVVVSRRGGLRRWALAHRQIGGYTGDVLGAFQQIGEIVMLLAAAAK